MASQVAHDKVHHIEIPVNYSNHTQHEKQCEVQDHLEDDEKIDYSRRAQWLRAAVLGANDGLVSVSSVIMGVGAVQRDMKAMLIAGFAGLVAGASSMAIGEYVSVHTQLDIELAQIKRDKKSNMSSTNNGQEKEILPNPIQAAIASAFAFSTGGLVPLLASAFIKEYKVRIGVVVAVASLALLLFGGLGAKLGGSRVATSCGRVLIGGWMAMGVTYGLTKLIGFSGAEI